MKNKFRKGFTLIELLLVIVVIAILAGTIMVSGDESIVSAEANNIINNMRILKTAALEWLADYGDYIQTVAIKSGGIDRDLYMVTYPYPAIKAGDMKNKSRQRIQEVLSTNYPENRATVMKYIEKSYSRPDLIPSVNEKTGAGSKPFTKDEGNSYAILDGYGAWNRDEDTGGDVTWSTNYKKWYVVYKFDEKGGSRVNKLKKKIEERAEEFGLYKNETQLYTIDSNYVYMEIVDFDKYFGKK